MKPASTQPPSFESEEELSALIAEGLNDTGEAIVWGSDEWKRFIAELKHSQDAEKIAS